MRVKPPIEGRATDFPRRGQRSMELSRLEIYGFKSFPEKTVLRFQPGVTAIVGPNGCGKSNIGDAIRWVLGEQRPSLLRSLKMEDVIFHGTAERKPVNVAEVSLTFSNNKGLLPVEYAEIRISRRVLRSGESQYELNRSPCRLKDIHDLFLGTGLGIASHVVVEADLVDALLKPGSLEGRSLLDEAAGIMKYKLRLKAARRKVAHTEEDILRLEDVLGEIEQRVVSLRRQARRAERYRRYEEETEQLELALARAELALMDGERESLQVRRDQVMGERQSRRAALSALEARADELRLRLAEGEARDRELGEALGGLQGELRGHQEALLVLAERRRTVQEQLDRLDREIPEVTDQITRLEAEASAEAEREEVLARAVQSAETVLKEARTDLERHRARWKEVQAALEAARRAAGRDPVRQDAERKLAGLTARLEACREEQAALERAAAEAKRALEEAREALEHATWNVAEREAAVEEARRREAGARVEAERSEAVLLGARQAEVKARAGVERLEARLEAETSAEAVWAGYGGGAAHLLARREDCPGILSSVADVVQIKAEYQAAVEAFLEDALQYVLTTDLEAAVRAIEQVDRDQAGRVGLIPLGDLSPNGRGGNGRRQPLPPEVLAVGREVVEVPPEYLPVVDLLLGDLWIVEDLETGWRVREQAGPGGSVVTRRGEVIQAGGIIKGGGPVNGRGRNGPGQREDLAAELSKARRVWEEAQEQVETSERAFGEVRTGVRERATVREEAEVALTRDRHCADLARLECERLRGEIGRLHEQAGDLERRITGLQAEAEAVQGCLKSPEIPEAPADLATLEKEAGDLSAALEGVRTRTQEAELKASESRAAKDTASHRLSDRRDRIEEARDRGDRLAGERCEREAELARLNEEASTRRGELETLQHQLEGLQAERAALQERLESGREEVAGLEMKARKTRREEEDLAETFHRLDLEFSQLEHRQKAVLERLRGALGSDAGARIPEGVPEETPDELSEALETARRRLKALGAVNMLALEEYEEEKARLDFMEGQRQDLLKAREGLEEAIRRINREARRRFIETFESVRTQFQETFRILFEGGQADLSLSGADPLEAEILLLANPEGKRMTRIDLLSGGERVLVALSFLFAIYAVKPSPFVVLDEVDAPLDDANCRRFLRLLQQMAERSQFIVVTHNRLTMEAADLLYGVTMEEPGVSTLVSVRLNGHPAHLTGTAQLQS